MLMLEGKTIFHKLWYFLRTYVLMLKTFDLFLQGSFLIVILLESNVFLLLRRDANEGYHSVLVEDYVMLGAAGAEFVLGAAVAWWGRGRRQLTLSGWLAATSAAGLMVLAFPFAKSNPASVELCGEQTVINVASDNNVAARTAFLVITALLCALTKLSIWAHGLTYLDDHDPQNGPYFYGILISIRLSLGLSGSNWLQPSSEREDWWEAHLSVCMLTFMFAFLFTLFPTRMSSFKGLEEGRDSDVDTGLLPSLGRLVRNKALVTQTLALSCLSTAVLVYVYYDRAYVQARYRVESIRQDPRTSRALSDIFRALVIIFFVMIFRVRFSARRPEGVKSNTASRVAGVIAVFVAIFFVVMAAVGCDTGNINGLQSGSYHQPSCSNTCGCNSERYGYSPVCALDTGITYFSPCHAGCSSYEDLKGFQLFHECSCAPGTQRAVRGSCTLDSCMLAYSAYQVVYTVMLAVSGDVEFPDARDGGAPCRPARGQGDGRRELPGRGGAAVLRARTPHLHAHQSSNMCTRSERLVSAACAYVMGRLRSQCAARSNGSRRQPCRQPNADGNTRTHHGVMMTHNPLLLDRSLIKLKLKLKLIVN